jgi:hypothetical protein
MNINHEPYIFILDLDGTIIGDCTYQCEIYNIQEIIKSNLIQNKHQMQKMHLGHNKYRQLCDKSLSECYNECSKLIRPYFGLFINKMKRCFPNSYFFVYTASEKSWALKEIAIIEKNHKIKFNRPIFTRDHCIPDSAGNLKKSVVKILPIIMKIAKLPSTLALKNKLLIIDNNPTFIDYTDNLLICPTYDFLEFHNLWNNIPHNYEKINELKQYVNKLIMEQKIHQSYKKQNTVTLEKIHKWLYKKYKKINKSNTSYQHDIFWKKLAVYIEKNNIVSFSKKSVKIIQKNIRK